jgi:hypothetical protein
MAVTDPQVALESTLTISTKTHTGIGNVISITVPQKELDSVEVSGMNASHLKSFLPGAKDPGKGSAKIRYNTQDAGEMDTVLSAAAAALTFVCTLKTSGDHYDWSGFITKAIPSEVQFGDSITYDIEFQATTWATFTAGS